MKSKSLEIILLLISLLPLAKLQTCSNHSIEIICSEIGSFAFKTVGPTLTCKGGSAVTSKIPQSVVTSVQYSNGTTVKNLSEIIGLWIEDAPSVKFIPTGIKRKFPNLNTLVIYKSGLLSVDKKNLKEFGHSLEYLNLGFNSLTFIDADFLEFNPNIRHVELLENPIRHIDPGFFTNLKNLQRVTHVDFNSVGCMSQRFPTASGNVMATFKWNNEECTDETARIDTENLIDEKLCLDAKISRSTAQIIDNVNNVALKFNSRFDTIDNSLKILISDAGKIEGKVENLQTVNKKLVEDNIRLLQHLKHWMEKEQ